MPDLRRAHALRPYVHHTLRAGVLTAGALLAAGLVATSLAGAALPAKAPPFLDVLRGALRLDGPSLLALGLLVLMATPVARVAVLAVGWLVAGDYRFGVVAAAVLALLVLSMTLGVG